MKRLSNLTLTMIALAGVIATPLQAQRPHFIRCNASGVSSDGTLNVCFKLAGLGGNKTLVATAQAAADVVYGCKLHAAECPDAASTVNVQVEVAAIGEFTTPITACLTLDPPGTTLTCPQGQDRVLISASYTNIVVSTLEAGTCNVPATFSANFFPGCP